MNQPDMNQPETKGFFLPADVHGVLLETLSKLPLRKALPLWNVLKSLHEITVKAAPPATSNPPATPNPPATAQVPAPVPPTADGPTEDGQ